MLPKMKSLDTYEVAVDKMQLEDIPSLHELSMSVRWPHRPQDWAELLTLGEGIVARDALDRLICSMMWFPMGERFASIGMGISSPRLQDMGAGRWMAKHILEKAGSRNLFLNATKDSLRLCLSFGFKITQPVFHYNGVVKTTPNAVNTATLMQESDYDAIETLDTAAMGLQRHNIIRHLLSVSGGMVIRRHGEVKGFALCRQFGRGHAIGPIVAETEEDAITLIQPFITEYTNRYLRVDTRQDDGPSRRYLSDAGLKYHEVATGMARGKLPTSFGVAKTMALASQALG